MYLNNIYINFLLCNVEIGVFVVKNFNGGILVNVSI